MTRARSRWLLSLGLAGTLALVWFGPSEERAAPAKQVRKASTQHRVPAKPETTANLAAVLGRGALAYAERPALPESVPDVFRTISWYVAPPPPPAPEPPPPPKPTAPPLPFTFIGQYIDGNRKLIILTRGDRVMTVSIGEVIDNTYKVESMKNGQLTFIYLPLPTTQALNTGVTQ